MREQWVTDAGWMDGNAMQTAHEPSPAPRPKRAAAERCGHRTDVLRHAVESQVIPRLLMARAADAAPAPVPAPVAPHAVEGLVDLLLTEDQPASLGFVEAMRELGVTPESLYLDLLTPAARRLGVMWEDDDCNFSDVTIGLFHLHNIMRALAPAFVGDAAVRMRGPRALLVQMPGEQHGLGLAMVAQFFRRAGWNVWSEPVSTSADLIDMVRREAVALVGISVSGNDHLDRLATDIRDIRRVSRNRRVRIMVGGQPFNDHPQLAAMVGADATAADGRTAVAEAESLVCAVAGAR